jgi:hypothetical protein
MGVGVSFIMSVGVSFMLSVHVACCRCSDICHGCHGMSYDNHALFSAVVIALAAMTQSFTLSCGA